MLISQKTKNNFAPIEQILLEIVFREDKLLLKESLTLLSIIVNQATGNTSLIQNYFLAAYKAMLVQSQYFFANSEQDFDQNHLIRSMIIVCYLSINNINLLFNQQKNQKQIEDTDNYESSQLLESVCNISRFSNLDDSEYDESSNQQKREQQMSISEVFSNFLTFAKLKKQELLKSQYHKKNPNNIFLEKFENIKSVAVECLTEIWKLDHNLIFDSEELIKEFLQNQETNWQTILYIFRVFESFLVLHKQNILTKHSNSQNDKIRNNSKNKSINSQEQKGKQLQNSLEGVIYMIQNCTLDYFHLHIHRQYKSLKQQILFTLKQLCDLGDVRTQANQFIKEYYSKSLKSFEIQFENALENCQKIAYNNYNAQVAFDCEQSLSYFDQVAKCSHQHQNSQQGLYSKSLEIRLADQLLNIPIKNNQESFLLIKYISSIYLSLSEFNKQDYQIIIITFKDIIDGEYFQIINLLKELKDSNQQSFDFRVLTLTMLLCTLHLLIIQSPFYGKKYKGNLTEFIKFLTQSKRNKLDEEGKQINLKTCEIEDNHQDQIKYFDQVFNFQANIFWESVFQKDSQNRKKIKKKLKQLYENPLIYDSYVILNIENQSEVQLYQMNQFDEQENDDQQSNENKFDENYQLSHKLSKDKSKKKVGTQNITKKKTKIKNKKKKKRINDDISDSDQEFKIEIPKQKKFVQQVDKMKVEKIKKSSLGRPSKRRSGKNVNYQEEISDSDYEYGQ
ncbi:hypothetical protein PPERSA_05896 [Pseudocohnilembus persalinus]|uniref:Uncharacterized protein n=1 Tax=Pseudocohnilembus persalinus TaxID=266149 RepID=A0A0V0R409_PSEPJ|nr:hypothetical protein PPERSA_05896 [Pseudocohnilembus persalinus]|eukprot:KRX09227.1 hypothetical protein PPERSA_05896 [Pseudocohnilembus persalinus]